jgi:hypothetical protein
LPGFIARAVIPRRAFIQHANKPQPCIQIMKLHPLSLLILAGTIAGALTAHVRADVITDWNLITVNATKTGGLNTNLASRIDAIESIAVYDAVNSIRHFGDAYHYFAPPSGAASAEAAAAQAAHDVLVNYFPAQTAALDASLATSLAEIADGPEEDSGLAVGAAAATDIIALRANDGSSPNVTYPGPANPGIGQWRPTPGAAPGSFPPGINQQWDSVTPFVIPSAKRFRPEPPPRVGSGEYKRALDEVKTLGAATSTVRTDDQTHIAQFYKQDAELTVNEAARELSEIHGLSLEQNAVLFALTNLAVADSRIAVWEAKYHYLFWRPITALNADRNGVVTNNYAAWSSLIVAPSHPDYPSGHSVTVSAGFRVLRALLGDDDALTLHTTTPGEPPRTIASLSVGERENGLSRIYGGIHFQFDNTAGQKLGREVGLHVLTHGPAPSLRFPFRRH